MPSALSGFLECPGKAVADACGVRRTGQKGQAARVYTRENSRLAQQILASLRTQKTAEEFLRNGGMSNI